ncbi:hypothetical protein E2C01_031834 [Portunus trituberculatus]|uniref:Uncharacterized protein n=1 Tax=Portunus trituberculatus TaxID=210409 RepID=A0A5B7EZ84_PORTR|nr:hypothetical protein [Portunus trituberculatus]
MPVSRVFTFPECVSPPPLTRPSVMLAGSRVFLPHSTLSPGASRRQRHIKQAMQSAPNNRTIAIVFGRSGVSATRATLQIP